MYLLTICVSSLEKKVLCPFLKSDYFLLLSCMNSLYNCSVNPVADIWFAIIFSHLVSCLSFCWYFAAQKLFSTLAGKIPWMEEPGGLQPMGSLRVRHDWATSLSLFTFMHWRRQWQPTPVFLPGESQGRGAWWAAVSGVAQSRTRLKQLSSSSPLTYLLWVSHPETNCQDQCQGAYSLCLLLGVLWFQVF